MLAAQLADSSITTLYSTDTIGFAVNMMEDNATNTLPVVNDGVFVGMLTLQYAMQLPASTVISTIEPFLLNYATNSDAFFTSVLKFCNASNKEEQPNLFAVTAQNNKYIGCIDASKLLAQLQQFLSINENGAIIVLSVAKRHYSFGELSRLVETNNAYITQLNTQYNEATGNTTICIKLNTNSISPVIATLQRYNYDIIYYFGEEDYENEIAENYNHLMAYLNI